MGAPPVSDVRQPAGNVTQDYAPEIGCLPAVALCEGGTAVVLRPKFKVEPLPQPRKLSPPNG
jgi:hypothetical protein